MKPSKTRVRTKRVIAVVIVDLNVKKKMYIRTMWSISMPPTIKHTSARHAERISVL